MKHSRCQLLTHAQNNVTATKLVELSFSMNVAAKRATALVLYQCGSGKSSKVSTVKLGYMRLRQHTSGRAQNL